jgi:type I restriction enzyme, R subunit
VTEKVKALINAHISARGVDPKILPTAITDAEFEKVLLAQSSSPARAAHMQLHVTISSASQIRIRLLLAR